MVEILHYYLPRPVRYKRHKGLSERYVKKFLEKHNWIVWRGGLFHLHLFTDVYPAVTRKYDLLFKIAKKLYPYEFALLQYLSHIQKGMPDFVCYRNGVLKFVECKFKNEQLSWRQKKCIQRLTKAGFSVEVVKVVAPQTKMRKAKVNVFTKKKQVLDKQKRLLYAKN